MAGIGLLAAACGGATATGRAPAAPAVQAASPTTSVKVATATVDGHPEAVLTDAAGRTLYFFMPEEDGKIATTAAVLKNWPPLLLGSASGTATGSPGLPGKLGTVVRPDGSTQVTYDGSPLYRFVGDKRPGDTTGQGVAGEWFVDQPVMPASAVTSAAPTPAAPPAPAATQAPPPPPPPAPQAPIVRPAFNDGDGDNHGGLSDGDGNG